MREKPGLVRLNNTWIRECGEREETGTIVYEDSINIGDGIIGIRKE